MAVIGLLLIIVGAGAAGFAFLGGGEPATVTWHNLTVTTTALGVFAAGALALLAFEAGVVAVRQGSTRGLKRRRELTRLRRAVAEHDARPAEGKTAQESQPAT